MWLTIGIWVLAFMSMAICGFAIYALKSLPEQKNK